MKRIAILGSTGSIGTQALALAARHPERFRVVALAARENLDLLAEQVRTFRPRLVSVATADGAAALRSRLDGAGAEVVWGEAGILQVATDPDADLVLSAVVGAAGLLPTFAAVRAGKVVALANKEALVTAGELITAEAARRSARLLPVDSEHSAIFQCLERGGGACLRSVILTGSGGPFRTRPKEALPAATPHEALRHPRWNMGKKISIDSATLMNKGLEVIEARWLFGLPVEAIRVLIHPESIVHSLVEYVDGSLLAQLSITDMGLPILYALTYPERLPNHFPTLDLAAVARLTFEEVDHDRFPCLGYAYAAARAGGTGPVVLNAANEVAVGLFLQEAIPFTAIPRLIAEALDRHPVRPVRSVEEVLAADAEVRAALGARYGCAPAARS
ncbi:MAG: 1-deoxy-D-xylulose-5-phosphate reductoisomerase [candidate division NC10 bacterium]|nr:1-deoxy-D-xylulose-5-phosphate reductoisomerase [candidate division NC10 bacterium]MBI3002676.1 1-deoxy-D-xylulose-5-phosphate reductoisomerase [candidate division NC10 bacterium]